MLDMTHLILPAIAGAICSVFTYRMGRRRGYATGYAKGYDDHKGNYTRDLTAAVERQKGTWFTQGQAAGEKIGFEKGHDAGYSEAKMELRDQFILFLEEQVRILKSQPPAPAKPEPPQTGEYVRGGKKV